MGVPNVIEQSWINICSLAVSLSGAGYVALRSASFHGAALQRVKDLEAKISAIESVTQIGPALVGRVTELAKALEERKANVDLIPVLVERIANMQQQSANQTDELKREIKNMRAVVDGVARKQ